VTVNGMLALGNGLGTPAASHLTIQGIAATQEIQAFTPASDVTWINMKARNFYFRGVQNMTVKGGIFGPCTSSVDPCENNKIDLASSPEQPNANITIDGATFHDFRIGNPSDHFECMFLFGGTNITVENSKFYNCEFYDIFVQFAGEAFNGLKIQNNWFDTPWNGQNVQNRTTAIGFSPRGNPFTDVLVRYNSFRNDTGVSWNDDGCCVSYSNFRVVGNLIGLTNGCNNSVSFSFNIFVDGTCGSTDRTLAALPYVNGAHGPNWDWHLSGGLPVDFVPGTTTDQQLSFDQDGGTRPLGAGYDAGADELR